MADRQDLVQEVINNIDDLEFCGRAYYAIGVRKLANGKLLECLDAFSKVLEYGSEGQVEYMQSQLYLKLLDSDRLKCPPSPADAAAQPEDNGTGAGEKKQQ
ncbi:MAG: hypothetical protein U5N86_08160 [Planctomycetota bacterium]|nr:hypothetical protein [Planctomycetota bacterium]